VARPPLANLFAVYDPDPAAREALRLDLQGSGEFAEVWCPAPGWVAASAPLPGGEPDGRAVREQGLAFAEGRDRLEEGFRHTLDERFREIAELADLKPERLASLPGDFGFIRFRPAGGATVVRSCGGLVPFYLWQSGKRLAISTQLGNFVRYLPEEPRLNPLVNATWASGWDLFPDRQTPLQGVSILGRGCFAQVEAGRPITWGRYWQPRPERLTPPTPARVQEHAERLRTLLIEKLERDLDPKGGNLLTLSGGVDSSSLAALAAGVVGRKVWTWSLLPSHEEAFRHEMSYIEPLARRYGFERRWEVFWYPGLYEDLLRQAPRIVFYVLHPALCSLPGILREAPVRVLFGGEYGDEVCGSAKTVSDWAASTSLFQLLTEPQTWFRHPRYIARWVKHRLAWWRGYPLHPSPKDLLDRDPITRKPVDFFHPELRQEYRGWWDRVRQEMVRDPLPWACLWADSHEASGFVTMNWEACSALGVRRSFPFFTREVFELVFTCHPMELYGPGVKKLLRAALKEDVPARNLWRPDKGAREPMALSRQRPLPGPLPEELEQVLSPRWLSNPPRMLGSWQYGCLLHLIRFIENLRARRKERDAVPRTRIQ